VHDLVAAAEILLGIFAREPAFLLLAALLLDALLPSMGSLPRLVPNPVRLSAFLGHWLTRRLDRARRSEGTRLVRGALATLVILGFAVGIGLAIERWAAHDPLGVPVEFLCLVMVLGQRAGFARARAVATALARGPAALPEAHKALRILLAPGWDLARLDAHGVVRVTIEATVVGFAERVIAPVFWFLLLGLPGLLGAVAINAVADRSPAETRFALTARRLDDALQYLPARLAGMLLVIAAIFVPTGRPLAALRTVAAEAGKHRSINHGWPIAATAGALGLSLAGPRLGADGKGIAAPWIGDGRARAEAADIGRMLYLFAVACLIDASLVAGMALARHAL
jgi:adenosylcobinamide-phosphate synthase